MYEEVLEIALNESSQYIFKDIGDISLLFYDCYWIEINLNEKV